MMDLGTLHHFHGISASHSSNNIVDLLQRANMAKCHYNSIPMDAHAKLSTTNGAHMVDPTKYQNLVGALRYLALTHPGLAYVPQEMCLFMHDPREPHLVLIKHILRYSRGRSPLVWA